MMKTEQIKGYEVEYNFFDNDEREMDETDIEHVSNCLDEGYVEGELNQYDNETEEDIRGYWKRVR